MEDFAIFVVLILLERHLDRWPDRTPRVGYPAGAVIGTGMVLWGIERTADQRLWLSYPNNLGSVLVQVAGAALVVGGVVVLVVARRHWRAWLAQGAPGGRPVDPAAADADHDGNLEVARAPGGDPAGDVPGAAPDSAPRAAP
jgi:hypothetical protein